MQIRKNLESPQITKKIYGNNFKRTSHIHLTLGSVELDDGGGGPAEVLVS
jgi:hypothetical protein